jgi:putative FmdB family regulatory protein
MPIYDLKCNDCEYQFEDFLFSYKNVNPACPNCGGEVKRLFSSTLIDMEGLFTSNPSQKADKESRGARLV